MANTLRNIREHAGTLSFNVPIGFSLLVAAMREDASLRRAYFQDLDLIFYAAAAVTPELWGELARLAREETGAVPLMFAGWGMSETAPSATQTHQRVERPGNVGVPLPGVTLKLVPDGTGRYELRVAGPNVMPGYFGEAAKSRDAFDEDGFLLTGDAVRFTNAADAAAGLAFDGRMAEDFKLSSGTWVRATILRLEVLGHVSAFAADVVLTGADRDELGLLIFPDANALAAMGIEPVEQDGALTAPGLHALIQGALAAQGGGSSTRIARAPGAGGTALDGRWRAYGQGQHQRPPGAGGAGCAGGPALRRRRSLRHSPGTTEWTAMTDTPFAPDWLPATLSCTVSGAVATLRLDRAAKRNALNAEPRWRGCAGSSPIPRRRPGPWCCLARVSISAPGWTCPTSASRTRPRACSTAACGTAPSPRWRRATCPWCPCCVAP